MIHLPFGERHRLICPSVNAFGSFARLWTSSVHLRSGIVILSGNSRLSIFPASPVSHK